MSGPSTAAAFLDLHRPGQPLLLPNPWDAGSARILASLGFRALATTSSGFAATLGRLDGGVSRDAALIHAAAIVAATELPVSADLENGFADEPAEVAQTVRRAIGAGLAGCSIEDATGNSDSPIYPRAQAVERVAAAAEAAHRGPERLVLTARAENYLHGRPDLADTIARLQAYQEAGADVLFAPGVKTKEDITSIIRSIDRPLNVLAGLPGMQLTVAELQELGVTRISLGGTLARAAYGALILAATEVQAHGTFDYTKEAASRNELERIFSRGATP